MTGLPVYVPTPLQCPLVGRPLLKVAHPGVHVCVAGAQAARACAVAANEAINHGAGFDEGLATVFPSGRQRVYLLGLGRRQRDSLRGWTAIMAGFT
jgi:hypothetical protein